MSDGPVYELIYWPTLQGRGELVRLVLEDAGARYVDVARDQNRGVKAVLDLMGSPDLSPPHYAPPFLRFGDVVLSQTANILAFLAPRLGLIEDDPVVRAQANGLVMTLADLMTEVHDTHHPVSGSLYYEDQKVEALAAAKAFREARLPRFVSHFEKTLVRSGGPYLFGATFCYADLVLFQVVAGLRYAFPNAFARQDTPELAAHHDRVAARERIAAYLASPRRIAFNSDGIFRHYPELDPPNAA